MPDMLDKVNQLCDIRASRGYSYEIEIDGGVGLSNASQVVAAGVDIIVAGSAVFGAPDIEKRVQEFKKIIG